MNYFDFLRKLKKGEIANLYLFFGVERYLLDSALERLTEAVFQGEKNDFDYESVDARELAMDEIINLAETFPVFSPKRLLLVKGMDFSGVKVRRKDADQQEQTANEGEEILMEYLQNPNPATVLTLIAGEAVDKRRKIYKTFLKAGEVVELNPLQETELRKWIQVKFKEAGFIVGKGETDYLLKTCGSNLFKLQQEIEKCVLFSQGGEISIEAMEKVVNPAVETSIFTLVDCIGEKNTRGALREVQEILKNGEQPLKVLAMIGRQIRLLRETKVLLLQGYNSSSIANVLEQHPYVIKKVIKQAANFTTVFLDSAWQKLVETDHAIKTGRYKAETAIELLIIQLK
jgi:DNA polymerase-3 subunit delta